MARIGLNSSTDRTSAAAILRSRIHSTTVRKVQTHMSGICAFSRRLHLARADPAAAPGHPSRSRVGLASGTNPNTRNQFSDSDGAANTVPPYTYTRRRPSTMFSCKSRSACGRVRSQYSDSDEDSSYGFKTASNCNRTRAAAGRPAPSSPSPFDDEDYHIYGNVTFGYKPILKTRLSSAASSTRRRASVVKRTVSFSGIESPVVGRRNQVPVVRPPPPCYSVAVRRASSFSTTRRNAAAEIMMARRSRMPLPNENAVPPSCNMTLVVVDVHRTSNPTNTNNLPPSVSATSRSAPVSVYTKSQHSISSQKFIKFIILVFLDHFFPPKNIVEYVNNICATV